MSIKSPLSNPKLRGNDVFGSGVFGAPRGSHRHKGIDLVAPPGSPVFAPISGTVTRLGRPYADGRHFRYVEITSGGSTARAFDVSVRLFYVEPSVEVGASVSVGDEIGAVQAIAERYAGITPHIHLEMRALVDPTPFIFGG